MAGNALQKNFPESIFYLVTSELCFFPSTGFDVKSCSALVGYPVYDPPHKVEDRILPEDKARENFQHFLDVRQRRVDHFTWWLAKKFGIGASLERQGIDGLLDWAETYVCVVMPPEHVWKSAQVIQSYVQAWTGDYAAVNALFDLGITFGGSAYLPPPGS